MPNTVRAQLKYLRIHPRKTRFIVDVIRGMSVSDAQAQLLMSPRRPSVHILKLLRSAIANATNNQKLDPAKLYIKEIRVDQGPTMKRMMPRARGSANLIARKVSHITVVLDTRDQTSRNAFVFPRRPKKKAAPSKEKKSEKPTQSVVHEGNHDEPKKPRSDEHVKGSEKRHAGKGFLPKMFQRKSI